MQNINQLSARLQQSISKQLSTRTDQTGSQILNTSDTQKLLKQIHIIKESDKKNKTIKFIANKQELKFQYLTEPRQINIKQYIQKEYIYEEKKKNSVDISNVTNQTWRIEKQMRQSLNLKDLHKLDESIAIDILNRQMGKTETNFYQYKPKTSRRSKTQQVKKKYIMNLSNTPFKIIKTKDKLNKTVHDFKTTNKDQIYYKLPVSNIGVPIIKTQRIKSKPRYNYPFSTMNNFNYSRLNKSMWVIDI
ncbi:unnamed protein product [Paramecium pentaurelia]|uniref:Uncharacterized protein n=1 Tax=Paramecium pentaurelia TaxID=43138 RepID=A0A8S1V4Y3_9CILI|nr:unnamed protein product [Paramecium pentaurelia]